MCSKLKKKLSYARRHVIWLRRDKVIIEEVEKRLESRPFIRILVPALEHNLHIDGFWAASWTRHTIANIDLLDNLTVVHS